jgi:hypothetical protein
MRVICRGGISISLPLALAGDDYDSIAELARSRIGIAIESACMIELERVSEQFEGAGWQSNSMRQTKAELLDMLCTAMNEIGNN